MVAVIAAKKTLAVNPAFLREIKDSNPAFYDAVHQLRYVCDEHCDVGQTIRPLVQILDALRDHMVLQFALEESYGFLEVPMGGCMVDELAVRARQQHCTLYLQLSELAERGEELQYRGGGHALVTSLVEEAKGFDQSLRAHETLEAELIERCFDGI